MATIDELTSEQIRNPEIFQKIKELGDSYIRCVQAKEAWLLQDRLNSLLKTSNLQNFNPELQKQYDNLLVALKWAALPLLPEQEVLNVLSHRYLAVLDKEDIDVRDRIEAKMFTLDLFPRNELRQKMQRALRENKERLGNKTFGEWLLDYGKTFDFRDRDELTHLQYVRQNPAVRTLSELEKNKLRKALQIFDKTLLVAPVMSEPLLSMAVRAMIRGGVIKKEEVNPALLQSFSIPTEAPRVPLAPAVPRALPEEKPEKIGFFKKLFGKKPKKLKKEEEPELILPTPSKTREVPEEVMPIYRGKISPYEKKREITPQKPFVEAEEEIPTFPKELEKKARETRPSIEEKYKIRTMKRDIEKAKRQPIPPKPEPKIKDNIVDLSGK